MIAQPYIAPIVALWTVAHVVRHAIDFDTEVRSRAEEVEHVVASRMLLAKAQIGDGLQFAPK